MCGSGKGAYGPGFSLPAPGLVMGAKLFGSAVQFLFDLTEKDRVKTSGTRTLVVLPGSDSDSGEKKGGGTRGVFL